MPAELVRLELATTLPVGPVNCYLLPGVPLTLVDAGPRTPETQAGLDAGLAALGLRVEQIELLVITHQHLDHVGNAGTLAERSGCRVAAHRLLAGPLANYDETMAAEDRYQSALMRMHGVPDELVAARRAGVVRPDLGGPVRVDLPLDDGQPLSAGGRSWRVRFCPGHSPSDLVLVDERSGAAIVGDVLFARASANPLIHHPLAGPADPRRRSSALMAYARSLEQLAALDLGELHPGHGEPLRDHRAVIAERLARQRERRAAVTAAIRTAPATAFAVACALFGEPPAARVYPALCEVLGALDVLLADGLVSEQAEDAQLTYLARAGGAGS